jgi:hypothetical protein
LTRSSNRFSCHHITKTGLLCEDPRIRAAIQLLRSTSTQPKNALGDTGKERKERTDVYDLKPV